MRKIKVLHIAQAAGGVDRYLQMLFKFSDRNLIDNVLVCSQTYREEDYRDMVSEFKQIKMTRAICKDDLKAIKELRKIIKKQKPDIVYAHSSKAGAVARIADIGINNHCIYNPHGWAFNMRCSEKKQKMYALIEKIAALFCEKIICISDAEKQSAVNRGICKASKTAVIYNGIDIEKYRDRKKSKVCRKDLGIPEDAIVVGMVGRLSQQKAPDIFIRVAKKIKETIPLAHFIIVGNGEQEEEIRKYAEDNKFLDALHITGWVDNPMDFVDLFDVACLLSRWEGFGLAIPEYMLSGKPVVASNVDAIPNIVNDHINGLLVCVDDVDGTYKAIMDLIGNSNLRQKLVAQGLIDVYQKFDAKRVAKEHQKLFMQLCGYR